MHCSQRSCIILVIDRFAGITKSGAVHNLVNSIFVLEYRCIVMNCFQFQIFSINSTYCIGSSACPGIPFCMSPKSSDNELIPSRFRICDMQLNRWSIFECICPTRRNPILTSSK
jgi:hypothetical protein